MKHPPIRRRVRPPLPLEPVVVPFAGGVGFEVDFGLVIHELNMEELLEGLAIRFRGITGTKKPR